MNPAQPATSKVSPQMKILAFACLVLSLSAGAEPGPPAPVDALKALVAQLGDPRFEAREEAQAKLLALDWKARPPLAQALQDTKDPEIHCRLVKVLEWLGRPHWKTDMGEALREAKALNKPLLVMATIGDLDGYT